MHIVIHTTVTPRKLVAVASLEEASEVWIKHRNAGDGRHEWLGGNDRYKGCGDVLNEEGEKIAHVAYNGRVFDK